MLTTSWARTLVLAAALAAGGASCAPRPLGPATLSASGVAGGTRLEVHTSDRGVIAANVGRDALVLAGAEPKAQLIGQAGQAVVVTDAYPSAPLGMGFCQAGQERFLRILHAEHGALRQTYVVKLESCRQNIELLPPGLLWDTAARRLTLNWLTGPNGKGPEVLILIVRADGHTQPAS